MFIANEVKEAKDHYTNSVLKLADRVTKKGLNLDVLTVKSGKVGVNIEVVITDGSKKITAQTIIASGPIQRPHYRYLVR